jgi:hypothetical protein
MGLLAIRHELPTVIETRITLKLAVRTRFCALCHMSRVRAVISRNRQRRNTDQNATQNCWSKHGKHSVRDMSNRRIKNIWIRHFSTKILSRSGVWLVGSHATGWLKHFSFHKLVATREGDYRFEFVPRKHP